MFRQIVKSAIDSGRLKLFKTPKDDHGIPIGPDDKNFLHWLLQADSFEDKKVKNACDGIKLSSTWVIYEHKDDILEGGSSIKVTMNTPSTGGQQQNPNKIDAITTKESKGQDKRKGKKSKP